MRAKIAHRTGDITSALSLGRQALALAPPGRRYQPYATAQVIHALLDLGAAEEADHVCQASYQSPAGSHWSWSALHAARARNHHARGDQHAALDELGACAQLMRDGGYDNPALVPWRSHAALVHQRLGDHDTAMDLAEEELVRARRRGADHTIATSLRILGRLPPRATEARTALCQALDLADTSGAAPLSERAYRAFLATGARPRRRRQSGVSALTEREHRIASLAATGMDNQAIASALFVSRRTVEFHLTHVYRKLAIDGRADLGTALTTSPSPACPPSPAPPTATADKKRSVHPAFEVSGG
ncbi:helix-turn-helix transcriptional regulator [Streptomyces alanosinicus]|nr:LuxR C-terminal-related transcriptional regulator [Streptomyces alanosinicus]